MDKKSISEKTKIFLDLELKDITEDTAEKIIDELVELIIFHDELYHVQAAPVIADIQYDDLFLLLQKLEETYPDLIKKESPTQKIAIGLQEWFTKRDHGDHRLLSLKNSYNAEDLRDRDTSLKRLLWEEIDYTFLVEPKFDGSAVHLVYEYGHFVAGITRGDGRTGEDITEHMKAVSNLPIYVPCMQDIAEVRLRAEVMLPKNAFEKINILQQEEALPLFANERNAVAGTLRNLDASLVRKRGLVVFVHDILYWTYDEEIFETDKKRKELLISWGLPLFHRTQHITKISDIIDLCIDTKTKKYLDNENLLFDGLVIKVNELSMRQKLWHTDHHPRRAMAFKFPAQQVVTKLLDITYQIGRTGIITPVAELEPVKLSWAVLSRATLHNFDFISKHDIRRGDHVWLQRSGEVIPYILWPVVDQRTWTEVPLAPPTTCPSCQTILIQSDSEIAWICPNHMNCLAQKKEQLKHFVSKQCMNITGLGEALIEDMVDHDIIGGYADIYKLVTPEYRMKVRALPGIADKKMEQLFQEIELSKHNELRRILHGLGIPNVGKKIARELQRYIYERVDHDARVTQICQVLSDTEWLLALYGFWPLVVEEIVQYSTDTHTQQQLQDLEDAWLVYMYHATHTDVWNDLLLAGHTIVLTWSLPIARDEVATILTKYGAQVTSSVSKKTSVVIYGDNAGSKLTKAQGLWVLTLSLSSFAAEHNIPELQTISSEVEKEVDVWFFW